FQNPFPEFWNTLARRDRAFRHPRQAFQLWPANWLHHRTKGGMIIVSPPLQLHFLTLQKTSGQLHCSDSFRARGGGRNEERTSKGEELMITKRGHVAIGIVTLSLAAVFVSWTAFAQHGPGQREPGSRPGATTGPDDASDGRVDVERGPE